MRMGSFVALAWLVPAAMGLMGCGAEGHSHSAVAAPHEVVRSITVVGRGEAMGKPDIARTSLGVEASAGTVEEAMNQANAQMTAIMDAVKKLGIADKDIRTANFSIQVERPFQPPQPMPMPEPAPGPARGTKGAAGPPPPPAQPALPPATYRVSNQVEITIRDVGKASRVLQTAVNAGANSVWSVSFGIDDTKSLEAQARDKAVADARTRAKALATLAGLKLGPVISVSEVIGRGPVGPMPMFRGEAAMAAKWSAGSPPLEGGELTVGTSIEVIFGLEQ